MKPEARNHKSETNPKHEILNSNFFGFFGFLDFEFVSDFELRISDL